MTFAMPSSPRSATTSVAPALAAEIGAGPWRPIRMIRSAPSRREASTADRPTAPSPITVTVSAWFDLAHVGGVISGEVHIRQGEQ